MCIRDRVNLVNDRTGEQSYKEYGMNLIILLDLKMQYTKVSLFETHRIVIRESGHRFL